MTKSDLPKFAALWKATGEIYGKSMSDQAISIIFRQLAKYEYSAVDRALQRHLDDTDGGRFVPKPADIVRYIDGDLGTAPMLAWSKVDAAVRSPGNNATVVFDDPIIMAIIEDTGGWIRLGKLDEETLKFYGNEFQKRYRGYQAKPPLRHPRKLIGIEEQVNALEYPDFIPEPRLIGDPQKALAILRSGTGKALPSVPLSQVAGKQNIIRLVKDLGVDDEAL
ncbi:DUF6475 domain-containing protein [Allohahella sp. A8]|uniref:DUF6475 domain-containing protein n=1 Tax=Allohahella sp. A8 TaxID=3141461 RepID=UPI003A80569B